MGDIQDLKSKLIAGKNEELHGLQSFANAQFYENLTKEEFTGTQTNAHLQNLSQTSTALNPVANLELMKTRLAVAEYYRLLHGEQHAYWVHYTLRNVGRHLNKYKFNYAIKGYLVFTIYNEIAHYRYQNSIRFLKMNEQMQMGLQIGWQGLVAAAAFMYL
eukprot:403377146